VGGEIVEFEKVGGGGGGLFIGRGLCVGTEIFCGGECRLIIAELIAAT